MIHYETNLDKNKANHVPLTPLSILETEKDIYRKKLWNEFDKFVANL